MESRKKLMPIFMFIGMGIGFMMIDYLGGTAFLAFMFIGMGLITMALGLIFVMGGVLAVFGSRPVNEEHGLLCWFRVYSCRYLLSSSRLQPCEDGSTYSFKRS